MMDRRFSSAGRGLVRVCWVLALCVCGQLRVAAADQALLVGVDDYARFPSLERASADARGMQALLQARLGLASTAVVLMDDRQDGTDRFPTAANFRKQVTAAAGKAGASDMLVVFVSGRAQVAGDRVFLVMGDGDPQRPESMVSLAWLRDELAGSQAARRLLVLDLAHGAAGDLAPDPTTGVRSAMASSRVVTLLAHGPGKRSGAVKGAAAWLSGLDQALLGAGDVMAGGDLDGAVSAAEAARATQALTPGGMQVFGVAAAELVLAGTAGPYGAMLGARRDWASAAAELQALGAERLAGARAQESAGLAALAAGDVATARTRFAELEGSLSALRAEARLLATIRDSRGASARLSARATALKAAGSAPQDLAAAIGHEQQAKAAEAAGRLQAAAEAWGRTEGAYGAACVRVMALRFAAALPAEARPLVEAHGGEAWQAVVTALESARQKVATGDFEGALTAWEQVLARTPAARATAEQRMVALMQRFDTAEGAPTAMLFAEQLVALNPENTTATATLARLRSNVGYQQGQVQSTREGIRLVYVPAGSFTMGSPADEFAREADETQHLVTLTRGFFMGVTEVTQEQFSAVMGATYQPAQGVHPNDRDPEFVGPKLPKVNVTWEEAALFCRRLSERDGMTYRLPTEAEWEYACRAGTTTAYHNGKPTVTSREANVYEAASTLPAAIIQVASFDANAWGLHDMHGNVAEWCQDVYGPYAKGPASDPAGLNPASVELDVLTRVMRGGSWYDDAEKARSANRLATKPKVGGPYIGFRIVLEADGLPR